MRHLACHIYPHRSGAWRPTVCELSRRWSQFDGARIVGIATDENTDSAEDVKAALRVYGMEPEYFETANITERREGTTFVPMLERIVHKPGITFFCHSKAATRQESICHEWREVMFRTCLDRPAVVDDLLERFALAGSFRRIKAMGTNWYYAGTFFWLRNSAVMAKDGWRSISPVYDCIERWPGQHFTLEESACLFLDACRNPYDEIYWRSVIRPALAIWERTQQCDCR